MSVLPITGISLICLLTVFPPLADAGSPYCAGPDRQVHRVRYHDKSGNVVEAITVNDASHDECSEGPVDVFVVSKHLGKQNNERN
jgi:hypothetical protein